MKDFPGCVDCEWETSSPAFCGTSDNLLIEDVVLTRVRFDANGHLVPHVFERLLPLQHADALLRHLELGGQLFSYPRVGRYALSNQCILIKGRVRRPGSAKAAVPAVHSAYSWRDAVGTGMRVNARGCRRRKSIARSARVSFSPPFQWNIPGGVQPKPTR